MRHPCIEARAYLRSWPSPLWFSFSTEGLSKKAPILAWWFVACRCFVFSANDKARARKEDKEESEEGG